MRKTAAALLVAAAAVFTLGANGAHAAPPANTVIGNQATATYNDAGGVSRNATSNLVTTTVAQVKSFTLTANGARTAAPNQTVYYPHTLTNTGNGTDTYALNAPSSTSFGPGGHAALAYYVDADGNGLPDNAVAITSSGPVAMGGVFRFVVAGTVPAGAANGSSADITVSATDTAGPPANTATNTDTTTVANSVITVNKALSASSGPSPSAGPVTVTLSYVNSGTAVATNVQLTDVLPPGMTYVPASGRWSVSVAAVLTDTNDGVEQSVGFPPGIDYQFGAGTVTAVIPSVPAGASGNVTFQVVVIPNLAPQTINNTAQYRTATQPPVSTNTAAYTVLQTAAVVANGSSASAVNGTGEPVTVAAAAAGSTFTFNNFVWNRGNGTDTFDVSVQSNTFPPGSVVTLLQQDGVTPLLNSAGAAVPDTGPIPGAGQPCPAPLVSDGTSCGYRVVVRVTLPAAASGGPYAITKRATSVFNNTVSDDVIDTLGAVTPNTVDLTNNLSIAGGANAGNAATTGFGASGATIVTTNNVAPAAAPAVSRFLLYVNNTSAIPDSFNLAAAYVPGVAVPALPPGWSVALRADGGAGNCSTVGAVLTGTGAIAAGGNRLVCAEVTIPPTASGNAAPGNYDFDFAATSATNGTVSDTKRDRIVVGALRSITLAPPNTQQTLPGGTVLYTHTLTNGGNAPDTATFAAACLADSRAAQGWTSSAWIDANGNGVLDLATDTPIACGTTTVNLAVAESRAVFVRVVAPAGAVATDPANVTTLTATYGAATTSVTDSTSVTNGLVLLKEQASVGCGAPGPHAGYATAAIPQGAGTAPGQCIAYRITATNTTAGTIGGVAISDNVPANARMQYSCSGGTPAGAPRVTVGTLAGGSAADGAPPPAVVSANVGTLAAAQAVQLFFCVRIDAASPAGTPIQNQARASAQIGASTQNATSNTVTATVGTPTIGPAAGGLLENDNFIPTVAGAEVFQRHTLTNTGAAIDSFTLSIADDNAAFAFDALAIYPDANDDGRPDGATPIAAPIVLAPGQAYRFVARYKVPAQAPARKSGSATIRATAASGAAVAPNVDQLHVLPIETDCGWVMKGLTVESGPSPGGPIGVSIAYNACDQARGRLTIIDKLPPGMTYVPGSGRWTGAPDTPLTDADASDQQGSGASRISYDFGVSAAGTVTATVHKLAAYDNGRLSFQVRIDGGFATGAVIPNSARYAFAQDGASGIERNTNTATYTVTGQVAVELVGQTLTSVAPGATAVFENVLTNRGSIAESFDITLAGSTFPPGTTFALFKADGVTPLADTSGNGIPDTGVVQPGATYKIVVRAAIPASAPPGAYKVTKTARSVTVPAVSASDDDAVGTVALKCAVGIDPDHQANIGYGQRVTYAHFITNHGNCVENLRAVLEYLRDSAPGWTSAAYVDNPAAGGGSLPGVVDATDTPIVPGWSATLAPGATLRVLVEVRAPASPQAAAKARTGKALASNVTTLSISNATAAGGALSVRDTTYVEEGIVAPEPDNAIRNFTSSTYSVPTPWGVIGGNLWLRADAAACNASPTVAETRTVVLTGPGGEREEVIATETGPDTGIFTLPPLPVRSPPVAALDRVLQGVAGDVFEVDLPGCGTRISTLVTLMAASSVVFDSASNEPIAGANVSLVAASGSTCGSAPVSAPGLTNPVTTGADGRFAFGAPPAGSYCIVVRPPNGHRFPSTVEWPRLPAGRNLQVTGLVSGPSYGSPFTLAEGAPLVADVPVDAVAQDGLFVQKTASRLLAELGDLVDYAVRVANNTGNALDRTGVVLEDELPRGFAFVSGSARRDGRPIPDPTTAGPRMLLPIGPMARGESTTIAYRVRIGAGARSGDGVNRVEAVYSANGATTRSNTASARVRVAGGVLGDRAYIAGRVWLDCNANGLQDAGERGVPGVRVLLEDGTYVGTDGEGKYSFYGITNRTHVLKVDATTLPEGARLAPTSARHLGDGASRIVDLKAGELHRGDFAVEGCAPGLLREVEDRARAAARADELAIAQAQLATQPQVPTDPRSLPASGTIALQAAPGGVAPAAPAGAAAFVPGPGAAAFVPGAGERPSAAPRMAPPALPATQAAPAAAAAPAPAPLESLLATLDNAPGFVGLADGATLAFAQAPVRVKGAAGSTLRLTVNGVAVPESRVGKRATLAEREVQAWEFIGVELRPGPNTLTVSQLDAFGNARGEATVRVVAPGRLERLAIEARAAVADGRTPAVVVVRLADAEGVPVTARMPVTLEASRGKWMVEDADPLQPGLQAFVEAGRGEFALLPPLEPGEAYLRAESGGLRAEARLDFLPELRSLVAAGVIEGIVNLRSGGAHLQPATASDGFEQEIRHLSRTWDEGKGAAGVRAAFYLRGKIRGDYLLTAAYDSDKDTHERLFRDIQPDEFYPVYGDSGPRGYDAQSTSKLYVRIDKERSYLLWGDFTTGGAGDARRLANYSRSLTGARYHYEDGRFLVEAFATRDTSRQVIEEVRANGTSGPFQLGTRGGLVNSEKVEIVTRDRDQPALILQSVPQSRFVDYEIDAFTGRLTFRAPVASVDSNLNPVSIRVTYEVDQGGDAFWVVGVDGQVRVHDRVQVGATYVRDRNPLVPFTLAGANLAVKVGEGTYVIAEAARTERGLDGRTGSAGRIEVKHESRDLRANAYVARTEADFDNPGAYLSQGRGEAGGRLDYRVGENATVTAEALRTEDVKTGAVREGLAASLQYRMAKQLSLELGVRHAREHSSGGASPVPPVQGQPAPQPMPEEVTTVRARVTAGLPFAEGASVYGEAEFDVKDADRKVIAVGGEYPFAPKSRIYARHELISSITGPYGLNQNERQNTTAVGVDTEYMRDGRLFSEYRIRDAISGGDAEAAIGLRNLWSIAPGLKMGTSIERVHALSGTGQNENTAGSVAFEYTGSPTWKGSTRVEARQGSTQESLLFTVGLAARVANDWTALARNSWDVTRNRSAPGEREVERLQAGLAYRDSATNRVNALARVEHRVESDTTQPGMQLRIATDLVSLNADWQLNRPFLVTGRYAARWTTDKSQGLVAKQRAQVAGVRLTWEFAPKWDAAFVASILDSRPGNAREYAAGVELGYLLAKNLWISAGFNFVGYRDPELQGADHTSKGPYLRMRYKFDEAALGAIAPQPAAGGAAR